MNICHILLKLLRVCLLAQNTIFTIQERYFDYFKVTGKVTFCFFREKNNQVRKFEVVGFLAISRLIDFGWFLAPGKNPTTSRYEESLLGGESNN